ncbi:3-isopropylmalate dehydratase small subunit [Hydrogenophaga sp.]|uniref:3-isopropylmalate dehydratase small subunit n=1 Tax=Hydrogenophaga sp. TaxID=1904254 RepID=UPI00272066D0|nr:3-isopropylmalate dehydratase small subunit [Hydrogenophaga sp.]MDO9435388.1 3-isopropylmalate dehydratase small subunit [Hydrogenophaga sp.]
MEPLIRIEGPAAPLLRANVDTDLIIRLDRLRENAKELLGPYALEALRRREDGTEIPEFVLNRPPFRHAPILLTGHNFGCGSSREGAVWALKAFGIRCIVAQSFGDIFFGNCFQNGVLPVIMTGEDIDAIAAYAQEGASVSLDLPSQTIRTEPDGVYAFDIDPLNKSALLSGNDAISETQKRADEILTWQTGFRERNPWIFAKAG